MIACSLSNYGLNRKPLEGWYINFPSRGKRVLLTGHTGFKELALLWLQELGARVWTFSLDPEPSPNLFAL